MTHRHSTEQLLAVYQQLTGTAESQPAVREGLSVVD
jgi:hypothetical protein